ncbi:MAG: nitrous oxide reductase family maturation protein NosD [Promethearchaeota archaeon]
MKSNRKIKILLLIILGIFCAFSPIITTNLNSEFSTGVDLDKENVKISKVWGKVHIDDANPSMNWSVAKNDEICTGNGTYSDPYVIEDLVINGGGSGDCILIENSNVYFRIENCTVYNSEIYTDIENWWYNLWNHFAGIRLSNVNNSLLIDNDCYSNNDGIHVDGFNNTISGNTANNNINGSGISVGGYNNIVAGNTANNNDFPGILLSGYNSTVSGNIAMNNSWAGIGIALMSGFYNNVSGNTAAIQLFYSDYNTISGNTGVGIALLASNYNTISRNTASWRIILDDSDYNIVSGNDACWEERGDCEGNVFSDNNGPCPKGDDFPVELIVLISVISGGAVIGIAAFLLIRRKRKRIE